LLLFVIAPIAVDGFELPAQPIKPSVKRGVGHASKGIPQAIDELHCAWYYNWTPRRKRDESKVQAEFVPMIWYGGNLTADVAAANRSGAKELLGFNEPDDQGEANMTVAEAATAWPKLMATGMRLGSPAPTTGGQWLDDFMAEAKKRKLRVDFLCLHWYGDITDKDPVGRLRGYLQGYYDKYKLPIWLTEYSGADFKYHKRRTTVEDNARFARESAEMMERLPFVERYAWYTTYEPATSDYYGHVSLYEPETKSLTLIGRAYRDVQAIAKPQAADGVETRPLPTKK